MAIENKFAAFFDGTYSLVAWFANADVHDIDAVGQVRSGNVNASIIRLHFGDVSMYRVRQLRRALVEAHVLEQRSTARFYINRQHELYMILAMQFAQAQGVALMKIESVLGGQS